MLVLSRKVQEKIRIGDNVIITVVSLSDGRVKLGFEAPRHIPVVRTELESPSRLTVTRSNHA